MEESAKYSVVTQVKNTYTIRRRHELYKNKRHMIPQLPFMNFTITFSEYIQNASPLHCSSSHIVL